MASLHDLFKALSPINYSDVPQDDEGRKTYLEDHLSEARLLVESVPQPTAPVPTSGSRSRAVSSASSSAEMSASVARISTPADSESWQSQWGKPIKFSSKDNPLEISVFKLSSKDGRGAWFARRSVHEGLSYQKWKKGLEDEFEQSLHIEGGPGAGKIRGLGAEKKAASHEVAGVGTMDVWHVSAQFPGPSAPRDFVSLVMTSDAPVGEEKYPNHFMVVSKPCEHEECPPKDGLVRGQYESVEFIREILPRKASASVKSRTSSSDDTKGSQETSGIQSASGKDQNKSVTFAESQREDAKENGKLDVQDDLNPVEWIMITRSDPGGSVPRFLVERGTPGGIVSDASKFLDWACKIEVSPAKEASQSDPRSIELQENPSPAAVMQAEDTSTQSTSQTSPEEQATIDNTHESNPSSEQAAPQTSLSRATSHASRLSSRSISSASFASAESDLAIPPSTTPAAAAQGKQALNAQEKALVQLANRKASLNDTLQRAHETAFRDPSQPTEKETRSWTKTQAKHDRETAKAEARYADTLRALETQRVKDEEKARRQREREEQRAAEKQRKEEKGRGEKAEGERWSVERQAVREELDACKAELEKCRGERDGLREKVRGLQSTNVRLATLVAKMDGGERLLGELGIRDAVS